MRKILVTALVSAALISSAYAKPRHPNLLRAHRDLESAIRSITAAQVANEFDLHGHAAKAKELLEAANAELRQAVEQANDNAGH